MYAKRERRRKHAGPRHVLARSCNGVQKMKAIVHAFVVHCNREKKERKKEDKHRDENWIRPIIRELVHFENVSSSSSFLVDRGCLREFTFLCD